MENTIQRIKKFIDYKGISVRLFEQNTGMSNGSFASQLKNNKTIGVDKLENILHIYKELNTEWLLTGAGPMLKFDIQKQEQRKLIPVYNDVSTIGGVNEKIANMEGVTQPSEWIDGGDWFSEATSAIHHYGDSMIEYPSGCILALKRITNIQMIIWGKNYVIETDEYRITKRLQRGLSEEYIRAYSTNKETYQDGTLIHQPIDILLTSIRRLELVLGYVVKEQSSGKIYNIINRRT
ncbi:MAG: hypothetical protein LBG15_08235 [Dysgonamonadaceae bacterium]|jgi:hypothetical protein|nr:hypothetical protein [Dysgonamonadaceae bacterium]